jgi:hypothetical protein
MNPTPTLTTAEEIKTREGYQSMEPIARPPYWAIDLELSRRPGVPMERNPPRPFPNTRYPPEMQPGGPPAHLHGRKNKTAPPVFGTSVPLKGLSGVIRKFAYSLPDHRPTHWFLMLLGDRVDSWEYRAMKLLPIAVPLAGVALWLRSARDSAAEMGGNRDAEPLRPATQAEFSQ